MFIVAEQIEIATFHAAQDTFTPLADIDGTDCGEADRAAASLAEMDEHGRGCCCDDCDPDYRHDLDSEEHDHDARW